MRNPIFSISSNEKGRIIAMNGKRNTANTFCAWSLVFVIAEEMIAADIKINV